MSLKTCINWNKLSFQFLCQIRSRIFELFWSNPWTASRQQKFDNFIKVHKLTVRLHQKLFLAWFSLIAFISRRLNLQWKIEAFSTNKDHRHVLNKKKMWKICYKHLWANTCEEYLKKRITSEEFLKRTYEKIIKFAKRKVA